MNFGRIGISHRFLLAGLACATSLIAASEALAQGPAIQTLGKAKGSPFRDKVEFSSKNFNLDAFKEAVESCGPNCRINMAADRVVLDKRPVVILPSNPNPTQCPSGQVLGPWGFCIPIKKP